MAVASNILRKCQARLLVGSNTTTAIVARSSSLAPIDPAPHAPAAPRRVLRSLGKQSSVLPHFQRDAIAFRRLIEERRWDAKLEDVLRSSAIPLSDGLVVEVIKALSEAKLALRFFIWIAQQQHPHFRPSANAIGVLSRRWSHQKQFDAFLRTLDITRNGLQSMTPGSILILLTGYGWAGMADKAVETLETMKTLGASPDASHFLCVLNILEREKLFDAVPRVHKHMLQAGFCPDSETYSKLILGLCIAGQKEEALSLLEEMRARGLRPEVDAYRIILSMFSKASRVLEVLKIFSELLHDGIEPDAKACNALIKALCLDGKSREALEVLEMMLGRGLNPNLVSLTMVIDGLFNLREVDNVFALWEKLNENSMPTVTFQDRLVMELCNVGKLAEADKVFEELKKKNVVPSKIVYDAFINGLCKTGNFSKACEFLLDMPEKLGKPDMETCSVVLSGLCMNGNVAVADRIFHHMTLDGSIAASAVYQTLLAGFCGADDCEGLQKSVIWIIKSCHFDRGKFCSAISSLGKDTKALRLLRKMIKECHAPDVSLYDHFPDDLIKGDLPSKEVEAGAEYIDAAAC